MNLRRARTLRASSLASIACVAVVGAGPAAAAPPAEAGAADEPADGASEPGSAPMPAALGPADFDGLGSDAALESAPLALGETIVGARWDERYGGLLAGQKRMYLWRPSEGWKWRPWPDSVRPFALFDRGGETWLLGDPGALMRRVDAEHFERRVVAGLDPRTRELAWRRAWFSDPAGDLWILAGSDRLLRIETQGWTATIFPISDVERAAPTAVAMTGRATREGDELLVSIGPRVWYFDGLELRRLRDFDAPVSSLAFEAEGGRAELPSGAVAFTLDGAGPGEETPLGARDRRMYDAVRRSERMTDVAKQLPGAETFWFPTLRVSPGLELRFDRPHPAFGLEVGAGVLLSPPTGKGPERAHAQQPVEAWFWPEVGYAWSSDDRSLGHQLFAGLGFGLGNDFVAGYYKPRVLVGAFDRGVAPGLRQGLSVQGLWGAIGLELSHGMAFGAASGDGAAAHDLRIGLDINLVPFVWALILWTDG